MLILAQFFLGSPTCFLLILKYFVLDQLLEKYSNLPPGKIKKQKWSEKKIWTLPFWTWNNLS